MVGPGFYSRSSPVEERRASSFPFGRMCCDRNVDFVCKRTEICLGVIGALPMGMRDKLGGERGAVEIPRLLDGVSDEKSRTAHWYIALSHSTIALYVTAEHRLVA